MIDIVLNIVLVVGAACLAAGLASLATSLIVMVRVQVYMRNLRMYTSLARGAAHAAQCAADEAAGRGGWLTSGRPPAVTVQEAAVTAAGARDEAAKIFLRIRSLTWAHSPEWATARDLFDTADMAALNAAASARKVRCAAVGG